MKPLLVILGYQRANDMVMRHMPFYRRSGADILGVGREDTDSLWPAVDEQFIGSIRIGKDSYVNGDNLIRLHLDTLEHCVENHPRYTHFLLSEPDAVFIKPPPDDLGICMRGTVVGGRSEGFHGSFYPHGPWTFDIVTARQVVELGRRLLRAGLIERGFPDRFYGLLSDLYPEIGFRAFHPTETYSQNLLDRPNYIQEARGAIRCGAFYVHGIKTAEQLQAVTEGLV